MARPWLPHAILVLGLLSLAIPARAGGEPNISLAQLQRLDACALEQLYAQAETGAFPTGCLRGRVLVLTGRLPKVRTCAFNLAWKGKCFEPDGSLINRWPGFKALPSRADYGPSWYDGRPSLVVDYPPDTPLFGNVRDEIREVGPGLYLGRLYEVRPCPRFLGFFAIAAEPECCGR